jgi:hypothetical protein
VGVVVRAVRRLLAASCAAGALGLGAAACGGTGDEALKDGADNRTSALASGRDGGSGSDSGDTPGECWSVAEGCHCPDEGRTVACRTAVRRFGSYVTCAGTRACTEGLWGPCLAPDYKLTQPKGS